MFKQCRIWLLALVMLAPACATQSTKSTSKIIVKPRITLYDSIIFDIVSAPGQGPSPSALTFFIGKLKEYDICDRVIIKYRSRITGVYSIWNSARLRHFETRNRKFIDRNPKDRRLIFFICYVPGEYHRKDGDKIAKNIAGVQYNTTSFAILRGKTKESYEGVVLLHEFGHAIRIARASDRDDPPVNPDRPNHCNNETCTMFWRASSDRTKLDDECLRELRKLIEDAN